MTNLSVNINKIATLRNSRGHNTPDLIQIAKDCERFGAQGITVHPRPDERHIRYADVYDLKKIVTSKEILDDIDNDLSCDDSHCIRSWWFIDRNIISTEESRKQLFDELKKI